MKKLISLNTLMQSRPSCPALFTQWVIITVVISIFGSHNLHAITNPKNPPVMQWNVSVNCINYHGSGNTDNIDWFYDMKQTSDGNYIACGYSQDATYSPLTPIAAKISPSGQLLWLKKVDENAYGGRFWHIIEESGGNYLCIGDKSNSSTATSEVIIAEFNKNTGAYTSHYYLLPNSSSSIGYDIKEVIDPNGKAAPVKYITTGSTYGTNLKINNATSTNATSDIFLMLLDNSFNIVNATGYNGITYYGNNGGKINSTGNSYGGDDQGHSLTVMYSGGTDPVTGAVGDPVGYALTGYITKAVPSSVSYIDYQDIYVAATDLKGNFSWDQIVNSNTIISSVTSFAYTYSETSTNFQSGTRAYNDDAYEIRQISTKELVIGGEFNHIYTTVGTRTGVQADGVLVFIDPNSTPYKGNIDNAVNVSHYSGGDFHMSFFETSDNGFIIGGSTGDNNTSGFIDGLPALDPNVDEDNLVAKFDNLGVVQWRRHFHSVYNTISSLNTNGNCCFGVVRTSDGGFALCGNSADDNDNAYIIKMADDCEVNYIYNTPTLPITSSTTWSTNININQQVVVEPGATLTINSGAVIQFAFSREIFDNGLLTYNNATGGFIGIDVKPGGKLVLNNCTLKGLNCDREHMWDGIIVEGNPTLNEANSNQGYVSMNNAIIENAVAGVTLDNTYFGAAGSSANFGTSVTGNTVATNVYDGEYYTSFTSYSPSNNAGGGVINATNSTFLNCGKDIAFDKYPAAGSPAYLSHSNFTNCTFKCDAPLVDPNSVDGFGRHLGTSQFVTLWAIRHVNFINCLFAGNTALDADIQGTGIASYDAQYNVYGSNGSGTDAFQNLTVGIESEGAVGGVANSQNITGCTFNNNNISLNMRNNQSGSATFNNFENIPLSTVLLSYGAITSPGVGVNAYSAQNSDIESNTFSAPGGSLLGGAYGTVFDNTAGTGGTHTYNSFTNTLYSTQFQDDNHLFNSPCNTYQYTAYLGYPPVTPNAWTVGPSTGTLYTQGTSVKDAGNKYMQVCGTSSGPIHINNYGTTLSYYENSGSNQPQPTCSNNVSYTILTTTNPCTPPPPCNTPGCITALINNFYAGDNSLATRNAILLGLSQTAAPTDPDAAATDISTAISFLEARHAQEDVRLLVPTYYSMADYTHANNRLAEVTGSDPTTNDFRTYYTVLINAGAAGRSLQQLTSTEKGTLKAIADANATGMAPTAQSLMDFLGIQYYPLIPQKYTGAGKTDNGENSKDAISASAETPLTAFPNPSTDATTFSYLIPGNTAQLLLRVTGIDGQVIHETNIPTNTTTYNWQHKNVAPGLYICQLYADGQLKGTTRIVIVK